MDSYRMEKKVCVVESGGELTITHFSQQFKSLVLELLEDHEYKGVVVNFKKLQRIDSVGLGVIVALLKAAKGKSKPFAITEMSGSHRDLFSVMGLDKVIDIYKSDDDAITVMTIKG